MRGNLKYLFLIIILVSLVIPRPALAFIDIFAFFRTALQGVKTIADPLTTEIIKIFFIYIIGLTAVATSGSLLKLVLLHPEWLSLQTNEMVKSGFHFTSGLANMLLILIFIIIAFAMILKIETFPAKKTLPKLIIVALLLNFSLVFIGMLIDISNILYSEILEKGFLAEGKDLIGDVLGKIIGGGWGVVKTVIAWLGVLGISFAIPFVAPWITLALIAGLATIFLPNILVWTFQIVLFFLLAGILFTYLFLFVARVFIIWILAVLAPLAFLCLILPQTEKYWKEWLQHLIQWVFVGTFVFFFLVLGLRMTDALFPPGTESFIAAGSPWPLIGWFHLEKYLLYYLFLFIYLVIVLWISKRTMPAIADFIIQQATTWGGKIWTGMLKPLGGAMGKQAGIGARGQAAAEEKAKAEAEAKGEKYKPSLGLRVGKIMAAPVRLGYRLRGTTPEREATAEIDAKAAELEKQFGKDTKSAMEGGLPYGWKVADPRTKAAMALYLQKMYGADEKGLGRLSDEQFKEALLITTASTPHRVEDIVKHRQELIEGEDKEMSEAIRRSMFGKGFGVDEKGEFRDKDLRLMADLGVKVDGQEVEELVKTPEGQKTVMKEVLHKKAADALKTKDVETLTRETRENEGFQKAVARWKDWSFIRELGETHPGMLDRIQDRAEKISPEGTKESLEELAKTNPSFVRAPYTPGGQLLMRHWEGIDKREDAADLIRRSREKPPTAAPPAELLNPEAKISDAEVVEKHSSEENLATLRAKIEEKETKIAKLKEEASSLEGSLKDETERQLTQLEKELSFYKDIVELRNLKERGVRRTAEEQRSFTALRTKLRPAVRHLELTALPVRTRGETRELDLSTSELIRQGVSLDELRTVGRVRDPEELAAQFYEKVITPKLATRTEEAARPTRSEIESKQTEIRSEEAAKSTLAHRSETIQRTLVQKERSKEEEELIKKAGEAIPKKPTRKTPDGEKSLRKDYLRVRKNVEAVDKDTKTVLAEIEKARKEKDEEKLKDLQKIYEDRQKELGEAKAELRREAIEYGKYLREKEEIEKEDKGAA